MGFYYQDVMEAATKRKTPRKTLVTVRTSWYADAKK